MLTDYCKGFGWINAHKIIPNQYRRINVKFNFGPKWLSDGESLITMLFFDNQFDLTFMSAHVFECVQYEPYEC